jgi:uncharacterized protein (TIGR02421 family)
MAGNGSERYRQTIRELSDRIVEAQRPIRILDAIKWDASIQQAFFASACSEIPRVDRAYYESRPLPFDPEKKRNEFQEIDREIYSKLGQFSPVGAIMRRMCREYRTVVRMLEARGTPEFSRRSQELYGSAGDAFHAGDPTLADLGDLMAEALRNVDLSRAVPEEHKTITGQQAVEILQERLNRVYPPSDKPVRVVLSDGIVSDAAAGTDYLKIRGEARFTERDLRLLEVHEGWVHLGTTFNGLSQPVCTFLGKGPPSSTVTQEGLAILMEVIGFVSYPSRLWKVTNRIHAVEMAEEGANFLDVFRFFREKGFTEQESYANAMRVFRGSTPDAGPFTKDICYSKGFVLVYNYVRLAIRKGLLERVPLLFCGKTTLEDMRTLAHLVEEGIVERPRFVPPLISDLNALISWMCFSNFLNELNLERIEADYANIL